MDALHNLEIEIQKTLTKIDDELAKYTKIHTNNLHALATFAKCELIERQ